MRLEGLALEGGRVPPCSPALDSQLLKMDKVWRYSLELNMSCSKPLKQNSGVFLIFYKYLTFSSH